MRARILLGVSIVIFASSVVVYEQQRKIYNCKSISDWKVTVWADNRGCEVKFKKKACKGQTVRVGIPCTNGIQGQTNCLCNCAGPPGGFKS